MTPSELIDPAIMEATRPLNWVFSGMFKVNVLVQFSEVKCKFLFMSRGTEIY